MRTRTLQRDCDALHQCTDNNGHAALPAGSKGDCVHIKGSGGQEGQSAGEALEHHLKNFLDPSTGRRRLTCLSRQSIPADIRTHDNVAECALQLQACLQQPAMADFSAIVTH